MGKQAADNELSICRKALGRATIEELSQENAMKHAMLLAIRFRPSEEHMEQLSLLLVLSRQLKNVLTACSTPPQDLIELIHNQLAPALLPAGIIPNLLLVNLEHVFKANQLRATDVLNAMVALSLAIPPPASSSSTTSNILSPLCLLAIEARSPIRSRANLILLRSLLPCIPWKSSLLDLIEELFGELEKDRASIPSSTIVELILKYHATLPEEIADQQAVKPLLRLLTSDPSNAVQINLSRYLLPELFSRLPSALLVILEELHGRGADASWISVATIGVSTGAVQIEDLPREKLEQWMGTEDFQMRLKVYQLLTGSKDPLQCLDPEVMRLIKECLELNAVMPHAGHRSEFGSATHAFFTRLAQADTLLKKALKKLRDDQKAKTGLEQLSNFTTWFFANIVDPALENARRPPVARVLLALNFFALHLELRCQQPVQVADVMTERRVALLISCQASEFAEVRNKARLILQLAPRPLPGYESLQSASSQALIDSAFYAFANPRKTQNEAATAALGILFENLIDKEDTSGAIGFVTMVTTRAEEVVGGLEQEIVNGRAGEVALHGLISVIRSLIPAIHFTKKNQHDWKDFLHHLKSLVLRIWQITRRVVSLGSTDSEEGGNRDGPENETARAHELLMGDGDDDDLVENTDARKLLSGCWRATKEAIELLAIIVIQPIAKLGVEQSVWSLREIDGIGTQFLTWFHEIRHRGTFSRFAVAFSDLVEVVKTVPLLSSLPDLWLESELHTITNDSLSTDRRSAGLPHSIIALVAADERLHDVAVNRLIELGRVSSPTSDTTKIHAFNILKIVLLDHKQAKFFPKYFESAFMLAVEAFSSANWNVRNVGLILFSTMVRRAIMPRGTFNQDFHSSRATLATRQTYGAWHASYPQILPFVSRYLAEHDTSQAMHSNTLAPCNAHTPLFPILIIVRSLRWSSDATDQIAKLKVAVEPYLSSKEWQIREVAAQALSSLQSPSDALQEISRVGSLLHGKLDINARDGHLLYLRHLFSDVIIFEDILDQDRSAIESLSIKILENAIPTSCAPIASMAIQVIQNYLERTTSSPSFIPTVQQHLEIISSNEAVLAQPFGGSLQFGLNSFTLIHNRNMETLLSFLYGPESMALQALWNLSGWPTPLPRVIFDRVVALAIDESQSDDVRTTALDSLGGHWNPVTWEENVVSSVEPAQMQRTLEGLLRIMSSRIVPLREAALPAVCWALVALARRKIRLERNLVFVCDSYGSTTAKFLTEYSDENKSQPSRWSAVRALRHFAKDMFDLDPQSSILPQVLQFVCPQTLLRLLQDDDDDIRTESCHIVRTGLSLPYSPSQPRAIQLFWNWMNQMTATVIDQTAWQPWLWSLVIDQDGFKEDLNTLKSLRQNIETELFEVERPNLFRDPLEDAEQASRILLRNQVFASGPRPLDDVRKQMELLEKEYRGRVDSQVSSPIDEAWEVRHMMVRRLRIWGSLEFAGQSVTG